MTRVSNTRLIAGLSLLTALTSAMGQAPPRQSWGPLEHLIGSWAADSGSGGQPGTAVRGGETWAFDLDGRVIVRRDFSEYSATVSRPAFRHDGLMIISPSAGGFEAQAFDNEGHVITYTVIASDTAVVLTSLSQPGQPQFRLTYRPRAGGYAVAFDISTPDRPGIFRRYVAGALHRAP